MEEEAQARVTSYLEETFYITSKKNTIYRVRLTEKGLSLNKENNGSTKIELISLCDIIGCRCMRSINFINFQVFGSFFLIYT